MALETQQSSNAADKGALPALQPADGARRVRKAVRDRNRPEQHHRRHRGEPRRW